MTSNVSHPGLAGYLLRGRIEPAPRPDGAVALVFDGNVRVLLHQAPRGELVAEAQLCTLSGRAQADDELLLRALREAAARPLREAGRLALPPREDRLLLQVGIAADASADQFETTLSRFLDAVTRWRAHFGTL